MITLKNMDNNHDGEVSDKEIEQATKIAVLNEKIKKTEAQERMAWISLIGILVFTGLLFTPLVDVAKIQQIGTFVGMLYITLGGIVAAFMGTQAWIQQKS